MTDLPLESPVLRMRAVRLLGLGPRTAGHLASELRVSYQHTIKLLRRLVHEQRACIVGARDKRRLYALPGTPPVDPVGRVPTVVARVRALLCAKGHTVQELAKMLDVKPDSVAHALARLRELDEAERAPTRRQGRLVWRPRGAEPVPVVARPKPLPKLPAPKKPEPKRDARPLPAQETDLLRVMRAIRDEPWSTPEDLGCAWDDLAPLVAKGLLKEGRGHAVCLTRDGELLVGVK